MRIAEIDILPAEQAPLGTVPVVLAAVRVAPGTDIEAVRSRIAYAANAGAKAVTLGATFVHVLSSEQRTLPAALLREAVVAAHDAGVALGVRVHEAGEIADALAAHADYLRVPSSRITSTAVLTTLAQAPARPPVILSTGASTLAQIARALTLLRAAPEHVALLQCVSLHPALPRPATADRAIQRATGAVRVLAEIFRGPVGVSDHASDVKGGAWAAAGGAVIIEKHLASPAATESESSLGALSPAAFTAYIRHICEAVKQIASIKDSGRQDPYARGALASLREVSATFAHEKIPLDIESPCLDLRPHP